MRDSIKTRDYFDVFIFEDKNRVKKFTSKLEEGSVKADRINAVKNKILQLKIGLLIAEYSRGDDLRKLKSDFESMIDLFITSWSLESYEDNLKFASLAYLFNLDSNLLDTIKQKLLQSDNYDHLIDFILTGNISDFDEKILSFPSEYSLLCEFVENQDVDILKRYLRNWYGNHYHSSWFDSHNNTKVNVYYGYWSFEAAAISKRLGLADEKLRNELYYPYDMVHFSVH